MFTCAEVMKRLVDLDKTAEDMKAMADKIQRQQKLFNKHDTNSSGEAERFEELKLVVDDITLKKKLWDGLRNFGILTLTKEQEEEVGATNFLSAPVLFHVRHFQTSHGVSGSGCVGRL